MTLFSFCFVVVCLFVFPIFFTGRMIPADLEAEIWKIKRHVVGFTLTFNVNLELDPTPRSAIWQH